MQLIVHIELLTCVLVTRSSGLGRVSSLYLPFFDSCLLASCTHTCMFHLVAAQCEFQFVTLSFELAFVTLVMSSVFAPIFFNDDWQTRKRNAEVCAFVHMFTPLVRLVSCFARPESTCGSTTPPSSNPMER